MNFKQLFLTLLFFISAISFSQTPYRLFYYETSIEQYFRMHPGASDKMLYVQMDRNDIVSNTLFPITTETKKLQIPESGYYEISGEFSFNLNTGNVKNSRAGINFGFVKIYNNIEQYVAATRLSFTSENQNQFVVAKIPKTIVYLEAESVLAPAISTGLLDKPIVNAHLAPSEQQPYSLIWTIKMLTNEQGHQSFY